MENITWLDGNNATNKFILQMDFATGGTSYVKNDSYEQICHHYSAFWGCPDVVALTLYNKENQVVAHKTRMAA
jgi:hypothetical protein